MKIKKVLMIAVVLMVIGAVGAFACSHNNKAYDCARCAKAAAAAEEAAAKQERCDDMYGNVSKSTYDYYCAD